MSEKSTTSIVPDGDDPPRFTREMAERGRHMVGDKVIREARPRGRPLKPEGEHKEKVTLRLSPDVLEKARSSGTGWQTRVDEQMRRIQDFQQMILSGKEPPPSSEVERQLREVMRKAAELIQGTNPRRNVGAASKVMRRVAAEHEQIAQLLAGMIGTTPLVPTSRISRKKA